MKKSTKNLLLGAGVISSAVVAAGVVSYALTKSLVEIALDRKEPDIMVASRQQLMKQVMLYGFACVDASLYLDTHPDDAEALAYFKEHDRIYREAVEEYSRNYGPLTLSHAHHCGSYWNWVNQPWPWQ